MHWYHQMTLNNQQSTWSVHLSAHVELLILSILLNKMSTNYRVPQTRNSVGLAFAATKVSPMPMSSRMVCIVIMTQKVTFLSDDVNGGRHFFPNISAPSPLYSDFFRDTAISAKSSTLCLSSWTVSNAKCFCFVPKIIAKRIQIRPRSRPRPLCVAKNQIIK